jgi:hypothetical protein
LLSGEPGIGKSRLTAALLERIAAQLGGTPLRSIAGAGPLDRFAVHAALESPLAHAIHSSTGLRYDQRSARPCETGGKNHGTTAMTPDRKRRDLFLALIDALLEHVKLNSRMDIRDRIAALALVDRVLAREKSDVDAERAGSKVREYSGSFTEARAAANGARGLAANPRQGAKPEPDNDPGSNDRDDDDREDDRENDRPAAD